MSVTYSYHIHTCYHEIGFTYEDVSYFIFHWQVNLLLTRWMKDLEKIFYGNIVAYNSAMLPEAGKDELPNVIWK